MIVAALGGIDGGCGFYRVAQPLRMLKKHFNIDIDFISANVADSDDVLFAMLEKADIVLIRPGGEAIIKIKQQLGEEFSKQGRKFKAKIIYDHDDNTTFVSPYSEHYKHYGLEDVSVNGVDMWKDKVNFDIELNKRRMQAMMWGIKNADALSVTTDLLGQFYRDYADQNKVFTLPNGLDFSKWMVKDFKKDGLRIGWHGGCSHYPDIFTINDDLWQVCNRNGATFVDVGYHFNGFFNKLDNNETHGWCDVEAHPYRTALLNLDIGVIPLADMPFNWYKSDIKFSEFAALKTPVVAANVSPYKESIEHGYTGYLYNNMEEFQNYTERLIKDVETRKLMGERAYAWVRENRDADKISTDYYNAYLAVLDDDRGIMETKSEHLPYIIVSGSGLFHSSAGIRALHILNDKLNSVGETSYIYHQTPFNDEEYKGMMIDEITARKLSIEGRAIAVYPEVVTGNPLHAKRVVRYVLNKPGLLGGDKVYDPSELVFSYNQFLKKFIKNKIQDKLYIPTIEPEIFNNDNPVERTKIVYYVGKSKYKDGYFDRESAIEITRHPNVWPETREGVAQLLREAKVFYCFDNFTAMEHEAVLCGCPVVVVPDGTYSRDDKLDDELGRYGIAWDIGELEDAKKTLKSAKYHYGRMIKEYERGVKSFINITQAGAANVQS